MASTTDSWGLSYPDKGKAPVGNKSQEFLNQYNAFYIGQETEKKVYLTFDAGYEAGYTEDILETLKKQNVKACFFVVGTYIRDNKEIVKKMVEDGHIVGNHTQSHPNMSKMSTIEDFKSEIEPVEQKFEELTGKQMQKYYRPPQGIFSEKNLEMANSLGYKTIFWSIAYVDWYKDNQPTKDKAFSTIIPRLHNGAIILLHSTSKTNKEILDELITKIKDLGYTFGSLDELK